MNREEIKALIAEWTHKPPGARPLLEKAIAEQYRKSREGQWLGLRSDELLDWLREAMADTAIDKDEESEIESRVARLLTEEGAGHEKSVEKLPLAALRAMPEHDLATGDLPSDEEIARRVRALLDRLDKGGNAPNSE